MPVSSIADGFLPTLLKGLQYGWGQGAEWVQEASWLLAALAAVLDAERHWVRSWKVQPNPPGWTTKTSEPASQSNHPTDCTV